MATKTRVRAFCPLTERMGWLTYWTDSYWRDWEGRYHLIGCAQFHPDGEDEPDYIHTWTELNIRGPVVEGQKMRLIFEDTLGVREWHRRSKPPKRRK